MDKTRLSKVSRLLQKELGNYFQQASRSLFKGKMISVTVVRVTSDLSIAKVYVSIFPTDETKEVFSLIKEHATTIRYELSQLTRHQLRKTPLLEFFLDDTLDYVEKIENLLK